jgi:hypothetical protein
MTVSPLTVVLCTNTKQGALSALTVCAAGVVTGGDDGLIKLWSLKLEQLKTYDLAGVLPYLL